MNSELPSNVVARYQPNTSGYIPVVLISGGALVVIIGYRMLSQTAEERLVALAMICLLATGTAIFAILFSSIKINRIEVTSAGNIEFVSRVRRVSHPRSALARVEGYSTNSARGNARSHGVRFVFSTDAQNEIKIAAGVPMKPDAQLQQFVRQIENLEPKVDTSAFWAWMKQ